MKRLLTTILLVFLLIAATGLLFGTAKLTFVNYYIWFTVVVALGASTARPCFHFWEWITDGLPRWLCCIMHTAAFSLLLSGTVIGSNYIITDFDKLPEVTATVTDKYTDTQYHTRRVGRNRYVRGNPYRVHYVVLRFTDGRNRSFKVSLSRYNRLKKGCQTTARMGRGALGLPIVKL